MNRIEKKFGKLFMNPIDYARKLGVKIGQDCRFMGHPSFGSEPWLVEIGNHVELSGQVTIIEHDGGTWIFRGEEGCEDIIKYGKVIIHDNSFVGMRAILMPGVEIGPNSVVGAGSVVTKSVPPNCVYGGNPAHYICSVEDYKKKCIENTPNYDKDEYKTNKKKVVTELLKNKMKL